MKRRGSQAIEFALALPMLVVLSAGAVDVGQYLYTSERLAAVASDGARAGALADIAEGEDAVYSAMAVTQRAWDTTGLPGTLKIDAFVQGAAPDQEIVVDVTVDADPFFGFIPLHPDAMTCRRIVQIGDQD
jgi:Flp pilus assembly protein TadG